MPLLMKSLTTEDLPPEVAVEIPGGEARAIYAYQGQLLSVVDLFGRQPATLFAIVKDDLREFLSPHHTRVFSNSFLLKLGMRLVTNRRRPIMVLGKDTVGTHDLLWPASDARYLSSHGHTKATGCTENAQNAFKELGISLPKLPDPVNLFLNIELDNKGNLTPKKLQSSAGGHVLFRVLIDCICVVSSAQKNIGDWSEGDATALQVRTSNGVPG